MRIFSESEATHYCSTFGGSTGDSEESVKSYVHTLVDGGRRTVREGSPSFNQYRDCSLRDAERSLFLAVSHYRRSLDLMTTSSSAWGHVTLYYGSWFASHALLSMFGCAVLAAKRVVDVKFGSPGHQELQIRAIGSGLGQEPSTRQGSHEVYWDLFYRAALDLIPLVAPRFAAVLSPISGDPIWQIEKRNQVNYDTLASIRLSESFQGTFCEDRFPACLTGVLSTQFQIAETLLELACSYACKFRLKTDALNGLGVPGSLREKVRSLICEAKVPSLV
jgi:hypothetical protein